MVDWKEYSEIKAKVEKVQRDVSRAEGALAETAKQAKMEFGCESLEEAEELIKKLDMEAKENEEEYQKLVGKFWVEWKDKIDE